MKSALVFTGLGLFIAFTPWSASAAEPDVCTFQRTARVSSPPDPAKVLKMRELSPGEDDKVTSERACAKTYAYQIVGAPDLDLLMAASTADIRKNLDALRSAFDGKHVVRTKADEYRELLIKKGWQREQVVLWGSYLLMRKAYQEGDLALVRSEADRLRGEFDMQATKVLEWDKAQNATYYSSPVLKNMIVGLDYAARIRKPGMTAADTKQLRTSYLKDRPAIQPFSRFAFSPDKVMFASLCGDN